MFPATTGLMKAMSVIALALAVEHGISREAAAQVVWSSANGSAWLTGGNWTGNAVPTSSQVAQFGVNPTSAGTGVGINMNTAGGSQAVGAIEVTSARSNNIFFGNSSTALAGVLTLNGATVNSVSNVIVRNNGTGNLTISNTQGNTTAIMGVALGNATINRVVVDSSGNIVLSSTVSGASRTLGISGAGSGRVDVTNASNTFGGQTSGTAISITGAEVRFTADGSLGTAPGSVNPSYVSIDGGRFATANGVSYTLNSNRGIQVGDTAGTSISTPGTGVLTYNGVIGDVSGKTGSWAKQGGGVLAIGGVSTYTGSTTIASGTIQLALGNDRLPTTTVLSLGQAASTNLGTLDLNARNQTIAGLASIVGTNASASTNLVTTAASGTLSINVTSGSSFTYGDGSATNSGVISGAVSIVKQGAGTQILGGANTYTGTTTLSAGTLRSGTGTVGNSAFGSGVLALNGGTLTSGTDNQARSFANNVSVGGDVAFGDATATGGLAFSGTMNLGNATRTLTTVQTTTFSGPISNGGLIKSGTALLTLSSSNAYSAGTTVSAGTLRAGNANSFGSGSVTLSASSTLDLNALAIANAITNNGGTLANAASYTGTQSLTAAASFGALGGTLSVINGGTATLTGAMTGTVSVAAGGQVNLNDGASLSQSTLANDGIVAVNQSGTTTLSTAITGVGAFQKLGSGILTVSGNNTYSGATTVSAGGLKVNGSIGGGGLSVAAAAWLMGTGTINGPVTVSGTLSPGTGPGVITLGSLVLTDTSTTVIDIASAGTRGSAYDGVSILDPSGLTYGGTVSFAFGGSAIANNTTFDIFDFTGSSAGSLAAIESTGFYAGTWTPLGSGTFQLVSGSQTLTFSQATGEVIVVPEPAAIAVAAVGLGTIGLALLRRRRA